MQIILANGATAVKDSAGNVMIKDNLVMDGASSSTWSPTARLAKDNGFSLNGSFGGVSVGIKSALSIGCDSEGNCWLVKTDVNGK